MKDYLQLVLDNSININFNPATVHIWTNNGKIASQKNSATVKLSSFGYDKTKALYMAIDQLLGE